MSSQAACRIGSCATQKLSPCTRASAYSAASPKSRAASASIAASRTFSSSNAKVSIRPRSFATETSSSLAMRLTVSSAVCR